MASRGGYFETSERQRPPRDSYISDVNNNNNRGSTNRPPGSVPYTYPCAGKQEQDRTALCTVHGREIRYARAPSLVLKPLADSLGLHGFSSSAPRVLHGSTNSEPYISLCTWRCSQCTIRSAEKVNRFLVFSPQKTPCPLSAQSRQIPKTSHHRSPSAPPSHHRRALFSP